jgi:calcineurin-like phosphoesterase family protein
MHEKIFGNINDVVGELDTLWVVGDLTIDCSPHKLVEIRNKIKCRNVHLIRGNHDLEDNDIPPYTFSSIQDVANIVVNSQRIFMSHYAHVTWPKQHKGAWMIFGHSHSSLNPWIDKHMPNSKMLDVGIDNAFKLFGEYRPFSFKDIREYMSKKSGEIVDHHTENLGE